MSDMEKAQLCINQAIESLVELKKALASDHEEAVASEITAQSTTLENFDQIKQIVDNEKWPEAVNANLICDPTSDKEKSERARGIIELMIEEELKDHKLLDYGCGEGYCVKIAQSYEPKIAIGFDVKESNLWENVPPSQIFTTNFEEVKNNGPYDIILVFDVIDHLVESDPVSVLKKLKDVLSDNGKIYMRCHPWTSRHATHLYHAKNKAFLHLVFTPEELAQIVPDQKLSEPNIGVKYPIRDYNQFIADAGLKVSNRRDLTESVESFFKIPKIAEKIIENTSMEGFPEFQCSICFIDYVLTK